MLHLKSLGQWLSETMVNFEDNLHKNDIKIESYYTEANFEGGHSVHAFLLKFDPLRISYSQVEKIVRDELEDENVNVTPFKDNHAIVSVYGCYC